jgi:isoleucyl-tRNA synthetase
MGKEFSIKDFRTYAANFHFIDSLLKETRKRLPKNDLIKKKIKANFKTLGSRMGAKMKSVATEILQFGTSQISELEQNGQIDIIIDNEPITILLSEVEITSDDIPGLLVANKGSLTVALDIILTQELELEGLAREFVNKVQKIRKDNNYELTDRIQVMVEETDLLKNALNHFNSYICTEILADKIEFSSKIEDGTEIEINDFKINVFITKT